MKRPAKGRAKSRTKARRLTAPLMDVIVQSSRWKRERKAEQVVRKSISAAAKAASTRRAELAIVLSDDSAIRALNRTWRGKNAPTNVLSFPALSFLPPPLAGEGRGGGAGKRKPPPAALRASTSPASGGGKRGVRPGPRVLGDIVIAYQTTAREARAEGKPFAHHLAHLAVHGYLHLLGHDHENDRAARRMERLEVEILETLGIPDPYATRDAGA